MQINCVNIRDNVAFFKRKVPLALGWKDRVAGSIRSVHWETRLKNHVSHLFFFVILVLLNHVCVQSVCSRMCFRIASHSRLRRMVDIHSHFTFSCSCQSDSWTQIPSLNRKRFGNSWRTRP